MLSSLRGFRFARTLVTIFVIMMAASPARAYFVPSNDQAAALELGQPNFTTNSPGTQKNRMREPGAVAVDPKTHKVFVADSYNNRVLRFASLLSLANGADAEAVLGQANFTSKVAAKGQGGMNLPYGVVVDSGGRLWVVDVGNNRVLRFDNASSVGSGAKANGVLGQPDFTTTMGMTSQSGMVEPIGVSVDSAGRLWVADTYNNRILRFDHAASKANGANADGVLGQSDFTSNGADASQSGVHGPYALFADAGGRLWVADTFNNRVLRFDHAAAKSNGANADAVLGQVNYTGSSASVTKNGMNDPLGVALDNASGRLYVSDSGASRVLDFNGAANLANGANASYVLGQISFTGSGGNFGGTVSSSSLFTPYMLFFDQTTKVLWVPDYNNERVLMYGKPSQYTSSTSAAAQDGWVLESSENSSVGGSMDAASTLRLGDDASNKQYRSILSFDTSAVPDTAVIRSVTLKIKKSGVVGTDPLGTLGNLLADMRKGAFSTSALELTDFQSAASASAIGNFAQVSGAPAWYQLTVPAADFAYVSHTGITQFRIRFATDDNNNSIADYDTFFAGEAASSADRPVLAIEYTIP
jgi:sugar lactone lactonase YvrE